MNSLFFSDGILLLISLNGIKLNRWPVRGSFTVQVFELIGAEMLWHAYGVLHIKTKVHWSTDCKGTLNSKYANQPCGCLSSNSGTAIPTHQFFLGRSSSCRRKYFPYKSICCDWSITTSCKAHFNCTTKTYLLNFRQPPYYMNIFGERAREGKLMKRKCSVGFICFIKLTFFN